jgi:hypothetical protein
LSLNWLLWLCELLSVVEIFISVGLLAPHLSLNGEGQGPFFVIPLPFVLSGLGGPTSIAVRVAETHKPSHHFRVVVHKGRSLIVYR